MLTDYLVFALRFLRIWKYIIRFEFYRFDQDHSITLQLFIAPCLRGG